MAAVDEHTFRGPARLSAATFVSLTRDGLALPGGAAGDAHPLELGDLLVLEALAAGSADVGPAVEGAEQALGRSWDWHVTEKALRQRGLLDTRGGPAPPAPPGPPTSAPDIPAHAELVLSQALLWRLTPEGFESLDHEGRRRLCVPARALHALSTFRSPTTWAAAHLAHEEAAGALAMAAPAVARVVADAVAVGLLERYDPGSEHHARGARDVDRIRAAIESEQRIEEAFRAAEERVFAEPGASERVPVRPMDTNWRMPPLALGLLVAYAKVHDGGVLEDHYVFSPRFHVTEGHLAAMADRPAIFLFSNYLWNHEANLAMSAAVKAANPNSVTIHGGPDTPKYRADCEAHFAQHPHVDITVRGEGEVTFAEILKALVGRVGHGAPDLEPLRAVAGLSFRAADGTVVHTADRDRVEDLDMLPSPMLSGLFDPYTAGEITGTIIETNRGCPYGCTFCDWGSATASRIRKFDLDRVVGELEWVATNGVKGIMIADANFGIFERDVEIAERLAALKAQYGSPQVVGNNYAKNTVKHLRKIISTFASAGIVSEGIVSLQSTDDTTLLTIRRKNIKLEKYSELSDEFRRNRLPLTVELMMGLPGATIDSLRQDIQQCIDRDVKFRLNATQLLPNSPMNDPAYREEHGIVARPGEIVMETSSYTRAEWDEMTRLRDIYLLFDVWGVLRHVARYVRAETGIKETELYERIARDIPADPERWPALGYLLDGMAHLMVPPVSWQLCIDELRDYLVARTGVADDDALATALTVQHALLPAPGRTFPDERLLAHDFAAWHRAIIDAIEEGRGHEWEAVVPPLRSFGPAPFVIDDPERTCDNALGESMFLLTFNFSSWELESAVARPRLAMAEAAL